ncbi:MucB/RseB C-terminal domain-containing protein [Nitrosospira briensis]|uniref:Sigma-E factor negative regulatory protein RseB n=1 Tax=Nitrosospira briensis TaxID=35799 RepID=A0A1I4Z8Z8_9PROT|nr:MucB/RseB C-terminal domain-containing protein [Nitrosospira briensis]SFN46772.1 sigma-E factor negative regulatory protein RseB [Nitrosospira briensis]SFO24052.1 sigma E regulatory protein, MucB/RseB [Nitrosospira briensis]
MTRVALAALLLLSTHIQPVFAQAPSNSSPEALDWLQKIAAAPRKHNYVGTFVYSSGNHIETSRIIHLVNEEGEHEKSVVLDGPPREIIRNNDEMRCYLPESKTVVTEKRWLRKVFPALLPQPLTNLDEGYIVKKGGQERVSDYLCQVIELIPRDDKRYGQKLWVDINTGLLLKAAVMDKDEVVEQFVFTELEIGGEISKEQLRSKYAAKAGEWHTTNLVSSTTGSGKLGWHVNDPPPGFKKIIEMKRNLSGKPKPIGHIALSDGLAAVSVFIEPVSKDLSPPAEGLYHSRGAINIYTRTLADNVITTVGEVPPATVMQIGNSVSNKRN